MDSHDRGDRCADRQAAAFQTLAHPIRDRVLTTLGGADGGLAYDRLRERVGVGDNGKFNYHLNELRDRFVEKRGERYRLTRAGTRACELLVTGVLDVPSSRRSFVTESTCLECGDRLAATWADGTVRLDCPACGACYRSVRFPSTGGSTRTDEALLDAVDSVVRQELASLGDGVCPRCRGPVTVAPTTAGWSRADGSRSLTFGFEYDCRECPAERTTTVGEAVLDHPAVVAFYHDHGVDVRERHSWDLEFAATDHDTRVRSRDPLRLELRPQCGNEELVLVVADDGSVVRASRHTKFTARDAWFDRSVES